MPKHENKKRKYLNKITFLSIDRLWISWHVKIPFSSCCVTKCAMINQNAELERNARFSDLFFCSLSHFRHSSRRPPTVKISSHSSRFDFFFVGCIFPIQPTSFSFSLSLSHTLQMLYGGHTCSTSLAFHNLVLFLIAESKQQRKIEKMMHKKMRLLIVKILVIFHLRVYQLKLSQCQFLLTFSVLNLFARTRGKMKTSNMILSQERDEQLFCHRIFFFLSSSVTQ